MVTLMKDNKKLSTAAMSILRQVGGLGITVSNIHQNFKIHTLSYVFFF